MIFKQSEPKLDGETFFFSFFFLTFDLFFAISLIFITSLLFMRSKFGFILQNCNKLDLICECLDKSQMPHIHSIDFFSFSVEQLNVKNFTFYFSVYIYIYLYMILLCIDILISIHRRYTDKWLPAKI